LADDAAAPAWVHFVDVRDQAFAAQAVATLATEGLVTRPLERAPAAGPGLLFFGSARKLTDFLSEVSREGRERVLAVAVTPSALDAVSSWRLLEAGASDVLTWCGSARPALEVVARLRRWAEVDRLVDASAVRDTMVGGSPAWRSVLRQVVEVAAFTDLSILVTGESGTGKELVAHLIHGLDPRPDKRDLVVLDCTTVIPTLSGSEFFGHERGAFTGAVAARDGAFARADAGTLFLDEVGELPLGLQAELLRVIQEGTYKRVGGNTWRQTRFRLVCATNRDLVTEQARGTFRSDFYHRIAAWRCRLPSLRERTQDILPLVRHFLGELRSGEQEPPDLDPPVRDLLLRRDYPGNVRELRQLVVRIGRRHVGSGPITVGDVPPEERPCVAESDATWPDPALEQSVHRALARGICLKDIASATRETAIRIALANEGGNLQRASRTLGITDRALQLRRAAHLGDGAGADQTGTPPR
jgi:transcriptional regulator with GAF, ATPase, and Fis domain